MENVVPSTKAITGLSLIIEIYDWFIQTTRKSQTPFRVKDNIRIYVIPDLQLKDPTSFRISVIANNSSSLRSFLSRRNPVFSLQPVQRTGKLETRRSLPG